MIRYSIRQPFQSAVTAAQRTRPVLRSRALLCALAALVSTPCLAEQQVATGSAPTVGASIDFRIVIPERIEVVAGHEQADRGRQFTSRTREVVDGREVITLARP